MAVTLSPTELVRGQITGRRRDWAGTVFAGGLLVALVFSLTILVAVIGQMLGRGAHVLTDRGVDFVTSGNSAAASNAGVWQGIWGSSMIALFVVALAFPIGIGSAIYLEEYARRGRLTRFITINVRNLAGVPAVVYGLLGVAVFVEGLRGFTGGRSVVSAGLTVAILVLPIVIITASEAIRAVPTGIREAGYGIGATRWEVVRHHVLPYAAPGVLTGTVLALARAIGEAAPVLLVGASTGFFASGGSVPERMQGTFTALPVNVYSWSTKPQSGFRDNAAAAGLLMVVVLLAANTAAILLRNRYESQR
jgi:phosphate transport system permease protein